MWQKTEIRIPAFTLYIHTNIKVGSKNTHFDHLHVTTKQSVIVYHHL